MKKILALLLILGCSAVFAAQPKTVFIHIGDHQWAHTTDIYVNDAHKKRLVPPFHEKYNIPCKVGDMIHVSIIAVFQVLDQDLEVRDTGASLKGGFISAGYKINVCMHKNGTLYLSLHSL